MKYFLKAIFICLVSFSLLLGCSQQQNQDLTEQEKAQVRKEIEQTWKDFIVEWEKGDGVAAASFFTADAINMPSFSVTQNDKDRIETLFTNGFKRGKIEVIGQKVNEVFVHGDMAYEFGKLEQIFKRSTEIDTQQMRYISVLKKLPDGWKFHRWMAQQKQNK